MNIWFTDRFLSSMMNFGEIIDDPLSDEALRELTEAEIAIINALKCFAKEEYPTAEGRAPLSGAVVHRKPDKSRTLVVANPCQLYYLAVCLQSHSLAWRQLATGNQGFYLFEPRTCPTSSGSPPRVAMVGRNSVLIGGWA